MTKKIRKAVILAGGKGIRISPIAGETPKPLLKIHGRPIIDYVLSLLERIGVEKALLVLGHKKKEILEYVSSRDNSIKIHPVENKNVSVPGKNGLADAVLLAEDFADEPFMVILGDEIYAGTRHELLGRRFFAGGCDCVIAVRKTKKPSEIKKNYAVKLDRDWNVIDLEEKPQRLWNDYIGCGTYLFSPTVFRYIRKTPISARTGKKEMADVMKTMIAFGKKIVAVDVEGGYVNINYPRDIKLAERLMARFDGK